MPQVKHIVLDVLKPHSPNVLEFAEAIAAAGPGYRVSIDVEAVDEKTETVIIDIEGDDLVLESLVEVIKGLGGSVHSIDHVRVQGED